MNSDMKKHRRQAAWICFEPHLAEDQLIKAIQILEHGFQLDSVSNLIAYVTKICSEFSIETATRKSLYGQFHELMMQETDLLIDPLSLVLEKKHTKPIPIALSSSVAERQPNPANVAPAPAKPPIILPLHALVFSHFMHQVIAYLPEQTEFFETLTDLSRKKRTGTKIIEAHVNSWAVNPGDFQWAESLTEKMLADLVHLVYTALCEFLGPIEADEAFHKAIAMCEQKPETRHYHPSRFL